jgi:hypothetical protein
MVATTALSLPQGSLDAPDVVVVVVIVVVAVVVVVVIVVVVVVAIIGVAVGLSERSHTSSQR